MHSIKEDYYYDAPITIRLARIIDHSKYSAFLIGMLSPLVAFLVGYRLGYLVGVLQPWVDARGWIALLFIAVGIPIFVVYYHNQKEGYL